MQFLPRAWSWCKLLTFSDKRFVGWLGRPGLGKKRWTRGDLNPRPPACQAGDLPLIYAPVRDFFRVAPGVPGPADAFADGAGPESDHGMGAGCMSASLRTLVLK